ncbi:Soma ferritin [Chionoecetes opilio]|uniref:Ferritin n=1 Tax=Chionoecetes opilio TaxID=41210 RepID=A0A8J4XWB3_CHIOP|nr:Soma ferritin [Chionoecetes opilio]
MRTQRASPCLLLVLCASVSLIPCLATARKDPNRHHADMPTVQEEEREPGRGGAHYGNGFAGGDVQPAAKCRHNYHERTEAAINRQINLFMHVGYVYNSMALHFGGCDVALPGFEKFFQQMADEQHLKASTLSRYQNLRGGLATLLPVPAPATNAWGTGLEAMRKALEFEKSVNQAVLELHLVAQQHEDTHASTYIQASFLNPQVEKIFTLSQYVTSLERVGSGLGEYMFDKMPQN